MLPKKVGKPGDSDVKSPRKKPRPGTETKYLKDKAMWYDHYYWGMNWVWWILWFLIFIWIFALPFGIPGQRYYRETPLDILRRRFAKGEINEQEYRDKKAELEKK